MSGQSAGKCKLREINNQNQGKSGSKVKCVRGPATGRTKGNATKSGGIMQPTRGKK